MMDLANLIVHNNLLGNRNRIELTCRSIIDKGFDWLIQGIYFKYSSFSFKQNPSKIDSENYFDSFIFTCQKCVKNNKVTDEELEPLYNSYMANGIDIFILGENWWKNLIIAGTNSDLENYDVQQSLIKDVVDLSLASFKYWELLHIYSLAIRLGLFELGYALREKAKDSVIYNLEKSHELNDLIFTSAISAQIEEGNNDKFENDVKRLNSLSRYNKKLLNKLQEKLYDDCPDSNNHNKLSSKNNRLFAKYLNNKSIAVVGPAKTTSMDAQLIDSHDIVIRCNYKEHGVGTDELHNGVRCDITYFNGEQAGYLLNNKEINVPSYVTWAVFKNKIHELKAKSELKGRGSNLKTRAMKPLDPVLFNGTLNAIPNIVLDLLNFNPSEIYIYHSDLMLTVDRHKGYYPNKWQRDEKIDFANIFLRSCSLSHDPVTQYFILNRLWVNGKIKGDSRFNEVMSLGTKEYMKQLQNTYGDYGRVYSDVAY